MEFSYYPGCSLTGSAKELDDSFRGAAAKLGVTLTELPDWTCCGASSAHMVDAFLETALPAQDLMIADGLGKDVVAPCAACHVRLKAAAQHLSADSSLRKQFPFRGEIQVLSGIEMFHHDAVLSALKERVKKPLEGLRVVPYYGCLAVRPPEVVQPDDPENPMQMDHILDAIGAEVLSWPYKTDCCGGSLTLTITDVVLKLSQKILDMARLVEADAIVTMCPMCQANLDTRQADIARATGKEYAIPILYVTELIGMALQASEARAWLGKHMVSAESVLSKKGLI
ncbi:MAG: CoB--CoM heterodisulfide reductase iron-sulfur subunit B family protein [Thermodesulfobacteriota bacterium]